MPDSLVEICLIDLLQFLTSSILNLLIWQHCKHFLNQSLEALQTDQFSNLEGNVDKLTKSTDLD